MEWNNRCKIIKYFIIHIHVNFLFAFEDAKGVFFWKYPPFAHLSVPSEPH
jgi:hypothetical protein